MEHQKHERMLEIFFRALKGEHISPKQLAAEYQVSVKSISRNIAEIQAFLAEHRELLQNAELRYSHRDKAYLLTSDEFLKNQELFAVIKVLLGSRCFSKEEILPLIAKMKKFTTAEDRKSLENFIRKEIYHYHEVRSDCNSVIDRLWSIVQAIEQKHILTITYFKMDRTEIRRRIKPAAVIFSEYYFYLIAYEADDETYQAKHFRIDRITALSASREKFQLDEAHSFDEGDLRERNQFMFPGKPITVRFSFSGLSVQTVLDRLPTARIIEKNGDKFILEAEVNDGRGLMMYLLSQGAWVKVLSPNEFADEMKTEIEKMYWLYQE